MKKTTYHHGDLRNTLLKAAIELLNAEGLGGLSLRAAAKSAGVSHAAPYRHFRSKTALLVAIAQYGYTLLRDANLRLLAQYPGDPVKQLYHAGLTYIHLVIEQPEVAKLMFGGVLSPADWEPPLQQAADESVGSLMRIIQNGKDAGIFADRPVDEMTFTALCTVHGLSMALAAGHFSDSVKTEADIEKLGARVYETLLSGLLKRS